MPIALFCTVGLLSTVFWQYLFTSEYFVVKEWEVIGNDRLNPDEACMLAGRLPETSLHALKYDTHEAVEHLTAHPAIHHAEVHKVLPHRIQIILYERREEALVITNTGAFLTDAEGVLFASATANDMMNTTLPIFTAPEEQTYQLGETLAPEFIDNAFLYAETLKRVPSSPLASYSEIHWEPGRGITLILRGGTRLVCGELPPEATLPKAEALDEKIGGIESVDYADLRLDSHIPWKPLEALNAQVAARR